MENLIRNRISVADSMLLIGIMLAAVYWAIESILNLIMVMFLKHQVQELQTVGYVVSQMQTYHSR